MQETDFCPRCERLALQRLLTPDNIMRDISSMAYVEGVTTPSNEYEKRLGTCFSCEALQGRTTCAHSGSLVAYRAKIMGASCPYPGKDKWRQ
ncbi:MAG: hypothetical protein J1F14_05440 [Treponema sp.]|nr:hypothetical protein [Treponema sp.]